MSRFASDVDDDLDPDIQCERCGGEGLLSYFDAPETWGEDCPSELDHLVECPACVGTGRWRPSA